VTVRGEEVGRRLEPDGCHLFSAGPAGSGADPAATAPENGSLEEKAAVTG